MAYIHSVGIILQHDIDEQYQYQPGEVIRGNIKVKTAKQTTIRSIHLKVLGEGNVSWQQEEDDQVFQTQEIYVDAITSVLDTTNFEPLSLSGGEHEFPFDYLLPDNIPSSFIGKYGNVTYTMKVTVNGGKSETAISSEPFLVVRRAPLPPGIYEPIQLETEKRVWKSCSFGKINMKVSLDKRGGVPGEDILLQAEIKNHTKRTVTAMQASLFMLSIFRAQKNATVFRQIVSKKRDEFDVTHMEGRRWTQVRLTLPPYIPESHLENCDIIEVEYLFQFRVELAGGKEIRLESPFWVGAQPQGLEIPTEADGLKITRQWTVRAKGMVDLGIDPQEPKPDYDMTPEWGIEKVPELRSESVVIANPLFQQNSHLDNGIKVMPDEFVENTKL